MSGRGRERGFTLIEGVVSIAAMAFAGMGAASMIALAARAQALAVNSRDAIDAGTLASGLLTLEIREIRAPMAVGLGGLAAGELSFTDLRGRAIRYRLDGTRLVRQENGGAERVVAEGVTGFALTYFRADETAAARLDEVRRIAFTLTVERGGVATSHSGQVFPRAINPTLVSWREE